MFINEPQNLRTVDHERDVLICKLFTGGEHPHFFVLEWQGRRIPFWAWPRFGRDPASGAQTLRWEVVDLGLGHKDNLPERTVPSHHFTSVEERNAAIALILEGLKIHGSIVHDNIPPIVDAVVGPKEDNIP